MGPPMVAPSRLLSNRGLEVNPAVHSCRVHRVQVPILEIFVNGPVDLIGTAFHHGVENSADPPPNSGLNWFCSILNSPIAMFETKTLLPGFTMLLLLMPSRLNELLSGRCA